MYTDCDTDMVEALVKGATLGISDAATPGKTTHHEVMSAAFTFLDRTLRSIRKLQHPADRDITTEQVRKAIDDLLVDHGHIPS